VSAGTSAARSAVVGPNAVIQLGKALDHLLGRPTTQKVFLEGGHPDLLSDPPRDMIHETIPASLMAGLWKTLNPDDAKAVASDAGWRTADYVIANRIPRPVKWLLSCAPRPLGARLLLNAIRRNAWTFCGSGLCRIEHAPTLAVVLVGNPLPTPEGTWHVAVFERLFQRLVSNECVVRYCRQRTAGIHVERYDIALRS